MKIAIPLDKELFFGAECHQPRRCDSASRTLQWRLEQQHRYQSPSVTERKKFFLLSTVATIFQGSLPEIDSQTLSVQQVGLGSFDVRSQGKSHRLSLKPEILGYAERNIPFQGAHHFSFQL